MEVRVLHSSGTNQAKVQVWDGDKLITTLDVSECCLDHTYKVKTTLNIKSDDQTHTFDFKEVP